MAVESGLKIGIGTFSDRDPMPGGGAPTYWKYSWGAWPYGSTRTDARNGEN
jgi:hypothetical protein